ncbi:MAG: PAS domain-containing protein [Endomicrobiales bacterium]
MMKGCIMEEMVNERCLNVCDFSDVSLVNSMADGVWFVGMQGQIMYANPAVVAMLRFDDEIELINQSPVDFSVRPYQEEMSRLISDAMAGIKGSAEIALVTRDGNELSVSLKTNAVYDTAGTIKGAFVVMRDNTERKKSDEAIQKKINELTKSNQQLQSVISQLKTLEGLIRICAQCKRICSESGEWQPLEQYITTHTNADFTHGLCEQCSEKTIKSIQHKHQSDYKSVDSPDM